MGLQNVGIIPKVATPTPQKPVYSERDIDNIFLLMRRYASKKMYPPQTLDDLLTKIISSEFHLNIYYHRRLTKYPLLIKALRMKNGSDAAEDDLPADAPTPELAITPSFDVTPQGLGMFQ